MAIGLEVLRDGPRDEGGEKNTYGLPVGEPIAGELREWFADQRDRVLGSLPAEGGGGLPEKLPDPTRDNAPMAEAMTPLLEVYWDSSGRRAYARLGLDPDEWKVTSPHLKARIEGAALAFCESTNRTTSMRLDAALAATRAALAEGMVEHGEGLPELTKRVGAIFDQASEGRARRIAATEASRAVHAAGYEADVQSGVVAGLELLVSADACPLCRMIATECRRVPLGEPFAVIGDHPDYSRIQYPPLHPGCQCTTIEVLTPQHGGPEDPEWDQTLIQPKPGRDYQPPEGKVEPQPEPAKVGKPVPVEPTEGSGPILPGRPIAERIAGYEAGDAKVRRILDVGDASRAEAEDLDRRYAQSLDEIAQLQRDRNTFLKHIGQAQPTDDQRRALAELEARIESARAAREDVRGKAEALKGRIRDEVLASLAAPKPMDLKLEHPGRPKDNRGRPLNPLDDGNRATAETARGFVARLLARGDDANMRVAIAQSKPSQSQRAYYHPGTNHIRIKVREQVATVVHELGHAIDENVKAGGTKALERSLEFLAYRVGQERAAKLGRLFPGSGFRGDEVGRKDHFDRAFSGAEAYYVGKDYGRSGTEVLSMGLQKLHEDPVGFARNDPEYCKFVLGILDGGLR